MNNEIKRMAAIIDNVKPFYVETIAEALYNAGYRKNSDIEAELQELNLEYYNEAKDLRRQLADTEAEMKRLKTQLSEFKKLKARIDEVLREVQK